MSRSAVDGKKLQIILKLVKSTDTTWVNCIRMMDSKENLLKDFCHNTTIHGLSLVVRPKSKLFKIFWTLVVFSGFIGLSLHLYNIINMYLEYKYTESTYEKRNGYHFPDVTMCNINGISSSNLRDVSKSSPQMNYLYNNFLKGNNNLDFNFPLREQEIFWTLEDKAYQIGHKFQDMILSCSYEQEDCNDDDFVLFPFEPYFNCYSFIRGRHSNLTKYRGLNMALSLILYMEPEDSWITQKYNKRSGVDGGVGFKVLLTPPNYLAGMADAGYYLQPGTITSLGFDILEHVRLSEPYNVCRHTKSIKFETDGAYSLVECRNMCIHGIVIKECGCFPTYYVTRNKKQVKSCSYYLFDNKTKGIEMMTCQERILENIRSEVDFKAKCNCHWPCDGIAYPGSASHSPWPNRKVLDSLLFTILQNHPKRDNLRAYQHLQNLKNTNASKEEIYTWVKGHFVRLNVYANSHIVSVKKQVPTYTLTDLLCQIGGCLGLWVGMSVITIVEVFDLIVNVLMSICKAKNN